MHRSHRASLAIPLVFLAACGTSAPATSSPGPPRPTSAATTVPVASTTSGGTPAPVTPTAIPRPSGTLAWPSEFLVEMRGRYFASPPFVIPMSIEIAEEGWYAGHLNPVFIDLQRYDGVELGGLPSRMIGFGRPENVRGGDGEVDVAGLTPGAAIDHITDRASITSGNRAPVALLGLAGERVDLHSDLTNNPVFGTADGDFGIQPELDARLAVLPLDGGLLMVAVLAPGNDLDAAWDQAQAILQTARLEG
ncbi:MAG TPA: hypothetical protein VFP56_07230 [Candidatus Limnocylindrales bacterium]|nr:hypothetical protein [Candidatus Limnocylindrales bacterium]